MRPASIVNFERFYLGSLAVGVVSSIISWNTALADIQADLPPELQFGSAFLASSIVIGILITLLLWYFVARRASVVAKWIVVLFFVVGLVSLVASIARGAMAQGLTDPLVFVLYWVGAILEALAVWMLFRPDARAWFAGAAGKPDADVFS